MGASSRPASKTRTADETPAGRRAQSLTFPPTIRRRADFQAARRSPSVGAPGFLLIKRRRGDEGPARAGFTITKKLGNAVQRNRIRRRLKAVAREAFAYGAEPGADYVIVARAPALTRSFASLLDDMKRALLRLSQNPKSRAGGRGKKR